MRAAYLSNDNIKEECLAVLVLNANQMKFLGVPLYPPGSRNSGDIIADLTYFADLLRSWNCSDSIVHSFIHSGDLYSASSRDYYSEALPAQSRAKKKESS